MTAVLVRKVNGIITAVGQLPVPSNVTVEQMDDQDPEVLAFVPPVVPVVDISNIDNLPKYVRAIGLMIANFTGKTPAQVKAAFLAAYNSLP